MATVAELLVPQLNVNDETVRFVEWSCADGARVNAGDLVCVVETSKTAAEIVATSAGVIRQLATPDAIIAVGRRVALIGPSDEAIEAMLADETAAPAAATQDARTTSATPKATALAESLGVSLTEVRAAGVVGTIKEADVRRFADARMAAPAVSSTGPQRIHPLPAWAVHDRALTPHELAVVRNLHHGVHDGLLASLEMELALDGILRRAEAGRAAGTLVSLLHVVLAAVSRALPAFDRLNLFHHAGAYYRHRDPAIGFVVKASDERLFTPVLRRAETMTIEAVATASTALAMKVMRGRIAPQDLEGASVTISHIPEGVTRFVALPSAFQSAILAVGSPRVGWSVVDGVPVATTVCGLTLTYDHSVFDGVYAASFLTRVVREAHALSLA